MPALERREYPRSERPPGRRRPEGSHSLRPRFSRPEEVWDEEKADEEVDGDGLTPALQALADVLTGDDLAAMLAGMRTGESAELGCENGTFELVRDR